MPIDCTSLIAEMLSISEFMITLVSQAMLFSPLEILTFVRIFILKLALLCVVVLIHSPEFMTESRNERNYIQNG